MDSLDFAIYRFLSRGGEARFWAGRRVIDPRVTPREIAQRVGVSESGVRARLRRLADKGYLRDRIVTPNPSLFGRRVFVADLPVKHSGEVDRILRDLGLVDGVIFTRDLIDEEERKIRVHFLSDTDAHADRLAALLGRLAPGPRSPVATPYHIPPCERELSRVDWKVLRVSWTRPDATFSEIADAADIALKTAARSYHKLIDSRACWWTHGPASEEFPLAFVRADLRGPADLPTVAGWVARETKDWMPVASDGSGLPPEAAPATLAGLVPADAPTSLERFLRRLAHVEGVSDTRRTFPLGSANYGAWFTDRLARRAARFELQGDVSV